MTRIFVLFLSFLILTSCNSNKCRQQCNDKGLDEECCPQIDSAALLQKNQVEKINVFIETSGSMAGYMPASKPTTGFQILVADILTKLNTNFPNKVFIYYLDEQNRPCSIVTLPQAKNDILNGNFKWSGSTYIPNMMDTVNSYLKDNSVNLLVTDLIYSPEKSKTKITSIASTDIFSILAPIKNYSSSIICLFSQYRSSICADKNPTDKSPYYLLLQGKSENIFNVESIVYGSIKNSDNEYKEINFGLHNFPYYSLLPYTEISSNFIANSCNAFQNAFVSIQDINLSDNGGNIEFWLGLDLKDLPEYSKTDVYLKQNLEMQLNGKVVIVSTEKLPYSNVVADDKPIAQKCSHLIKLRVSELSDCVSILSLSLKCTSPDWPIELNEKTSENNREKTFGLEKIISGFKQAYISDQDEYFFKNLSIALIKE